MILVMQTIHFFIFFCDDIDQPSISITMGILVSAYTARYSSGVCVELYICMDLTTTNVCE